MEGDMARGEHILCQGRAELLTTNSDRKSLILKIAQSGEILGLNSALAGRPYEITVETLQPCQLAYIGREDFLTFIPDHADPCLEVAHHLGRDCHSAYDAIECGWISGNCGREKLHGDEAEQASVFRFVDDSHTTTADFFDDTIVRDSLADERVVGRHGGHVRWRERASQRRRKLMCGS
jgi:hypothetical protein